MMMLTIKSQTDDPKRALEIVEDQLLSFAAGVLNVMRSAGLDEGNQQDPER